ncbi:MAG: lipopolysaccharide transport periplasmic protein LptA [Pseudomonadota bacterium]
MAVCLALISGAAQAERADRDKPMRMEADHASLDDIKQTSTFEGNVRLNQGTLNISGDKLVVTQGKDSYARGTATGRPASFRQKRENVDEYVEGYADRVEYDGKTETVDLYGHARLKRAQDEVRGEHITYSSKTEIFQVRNAAPGQVVNPTGNRVRVIIQPKGKGAATGSTAPQVQIQADEMLRQPEAPQ